MISKKETPRAGSLSDHPKLDPIVRAALIQNRNKFLQFLNQRVEHKELAEDILQQFFLRALYKENDLKKPGSVVAWLYRVLNSTLIDFYRSEAKRHQGEAEYARSQPDHVQECDVHPENVCMCFYELIPALKGEYVELLQRIDLNGESQATVANELGITVNLARVRLHRARQALKQTLLMSCCKACHEDGFMNCECTHGGKEHCT